MGERMRFIGRLLTGEKMAKFCREFGISRKTGYKFWNRYDEIRLPGLTNRMRRPFRYANQLPMALCFTTLAKALFWTYWKENALEFEPVEIAK